MENVLSLGNAKVLVQSHCLLGEGVMWHAKRKSCFWVDIEDLLIYEYDWILGSTKKYESKSRVSLLVEAEEGLIVGLQGGVFRFDPTSKIFSLIADIGENWTTHRCNDGICDNRGRLWVSTMELSHLQGSGSVYRVDSQNSAQKIIGQATIPNGMAWSNDGKRLYYIDSACNCINTYLYDESTGSILFEKIAVTIPGYLGVPDGMTIDDKGMLWVAMWGGFCVGCFDVNSGTLRGLINVPVPYVTSCSFAGEDLDHLIITTAIADMTPNELLKYPESGHTYIVKTESRGVISHICKL